MEFGSNSMSSSSPPSSSPLFDGPDTKLELRNSSPTAPVSVSAAAAEKEHMFDKVVTPSDVGKLNRLVIPKQHAEKYFPLDSTSNEKGLLLNFEDRNGKQWRFRYSYWNSSQSYVMTKGWSRFVKEKKLDAGDVVSFHRGLGGGADTTDRMFIDWRRRPDAPDHHHHHHHAPPTLFYPPPGITFSSGRSIPWGPQLMRPQGGAHHLHNLHYFPQPQMPPPSSSFNYAGIGLHHHQNPYRNSYIGGGGGGGGPFGAPAGPVFYVRPPGEQLARQQAGHRVDQSVVFDSVPVVHGNKSAAAVSGKRLRLFGVNMECPTSENSNEECELRLYNGTPIPGISTSVDYLNNNNKGKASMTTFNLDI